MFYYYVVQCYLQEYSIGTTEWWTRGGQVGCRGSRDEDGGSVSAFSAGTSVEQYYDDPDIFLEFGR